ncbi:MAG TPA: LLM class F420-dependent oxidoreductase [Candidatus Sulfomarinibacteraceae bacterium]|nr:LLM class F420-dependent oxidoreductase [Candidatus Sulfomarinibacteraceae bacterium]
MEVAIMIEGQNGLNWPRWRRIARAVEELGFVGLFRSDHYTNASAPDKDSLELWVSLTWLADNSERLEFGPMVTPFSFREPTMTARMAAGVDDLSGGRLILGLGAGWQEREHHKFGHDLLPTAQRFDRFEEGMEVVTRLLQQDEPVDFDGEYYQLNEALLLPRPQRAGGPPILVGGNGPRRTLPLAARYAQEWNGVFTTAEHFAELNSRLDELLEAEDRQPQDVRRSLMTGTIFGRDETEVDEKAAARGRSVEELRQHGLIVGAGDDFVQQIKAYEEAGAYRILLQWLDLDDLDGLAAMAHTVLPHL